MEGITQEYSVVWGKFCKKANFPCAFAAKHRFDSVRKQSSSGGAFYALAKCVIDQGGIVYGCAFNSKHAAIHIRCETMDEVVRCMGSKYSQSVMGTSVQQVKSDLEAGKTVLFTGTPCQVAVVRSVCKSWSVDVKTANHETLNIQVAELKAAESKAADIKTLDAENLDTETSTVKRKKSSGKHRQLQFYFVRKRVLWMQRLCFDLPCWSACNDS